MIEFSCRVKAMRVKKIIDEDFNNYKDICMFICTASCNGKCCREAGIPMSVCQNAPWRSAPIKEVSDDAIIHRYMRNNITTGICFGGLEPLEQFEELFRFIERLRRVYRCNDVVVIYTGYYEIEVSSQIERLKQFSNIVVKFGRFIPNQSPHYDEVLGVDLASDNQYAVIFNPIEGETDVSKTES